MEKVHDLKVKVQELRFEAGHQEDEILLWNSKLEGDVGVFEMSVNDLDARIKELKSASLQAAKKVEEDQAVEIRERKYHEEMQFEKTKLEQNLKYEMQMEENPKNLNNKEQSINAKLPKLVVTKFSGTHTDWSRFWNQLKAEIDSADVHVSPITKFSYLNELLELLNHKRLWTSKEHTENQVWKGKRNCQRTPYQHNVTSSHLWI